MNWNLDPHRRRRLVGLQAASFCHVGPRKRRSILLLTVNNNPEPEGPRDRETGESGKHSKSRTRLLWAHLIRTPNASNGLRDSVQI